MGSNIDILKMKSDRLTFIPLTASHAGDLYKLWSNPKVVQYMYCPLKKSVDECKEWIFELLNRNEEKNDFVALYNGSIIGIGGVPCWNKEQREYGLYYQICEEYWKMGFGVEIAETLMRYAFIKCNAEKIDTYAVTENKGSINVLKKIGMELSHKRIDGFEKDGKRYDEYNFMITKDDWYSNYKVIKEK